jgi:hypothetical protein
MEYKCSDREWKKITDDLFRICQKYEIDFGSNFSEHSAFIRPSTSSRECVYSEIRELLKDRKDIKIKEPDKDSVDGITLTVVRG